MLHAGPPDPSAPNALEYLKGLWVEKTIVKHQRYHSYEETAEHRSWNPHSVPGHHAEQPRGGQEKKSIFDEHDQVEARHATS